jgi:predicted ester cyclase
MTRPAINSAEAFLAAIGRHEVEDALKEACPGATVEIVPLDASGLLAKEGRNFLCELIDAFPDLELRTRRIFAGNDGTVVVELTMDGTQAAPFLGIINQEKHVDLDQAWMIKVTDGLVERVKMFWCNNQLYRRLGVRRLDRVTITA